MDRIAAVFPGQGSQSPGMLAALADEWPQVEQTFAEASTVLGYDLWGVVRDNPGDHLNQTRCTQPAMLTADVAVARVWQAAGGPAPARVAGHSLGEYAALVHAGVLAFEDAVRVVAERARLMQQAVPDGEGGMAALLGLDDERVIALCESVAGRGIVEPVNFNAPGQVVIAGHADAVAQAIERAREAGAKRAVELPVSVPAHSSLMREAAAALGATLEQTPLHSPAVPVIHNVDAAAHDDPSSIREALQRQLYNPVRWSECIGALRAANVDTVIELGPGRVLTGLTRRIDRSLTGLAVEDPTTLQKALGQCREEDA